MQNEFEYRTDGNWWAPPIDPSDEWDYTIDLTDVLDGDTIASVQWAAESGITIDVGKLSNTDSTVTVWLKDGVVAATPRITFTVTTNRPRVFERSFKIEVKEL